RGMSQGYHKTGISSFASVIPLQSNLRVTKSDFAISVNSAFAISQKSTQSNWFIFPQVGVSTFSISSLLHATLTGFFHVQTTENAETLCVIAYISDLIHLISLVSKNNHDYMVGFKLMKNHILASPEVPHHCKANGAPTTGSMNTLTEQYQFLASETGLLCDISKHKVEVP
ncbi:MAG: hypothetical protein GY737_30615, partial [Desulfobacteraceae bacterium]|nr:hypothetical protein [Desulfobacteraceae bacterium]